MDPYPFRTPDDRSLPLIGPLIARCSHRWLQCSGGDLRLEAIALPFALDLTVHRHREWHAVGQEHREKPVGREVPCKEIGAERAEADLN